MNAIEIRDLTKSYTGFTLSHLNLTLPNGCIMGLVGENGAGKSTTIKLILDMINKDSGSITILGKDNQDNINCTKEEVGVVLDEIGFPECLTAIQVGKIMQSTYQNWDKTVYSNLLQQFSMPENKPFGEYSSGMKMKLGIAVAFSHHPKLLILDEATNGLDPVARDEVIDMVCEFTRDENHAVLISSHIVTDLEKICDYIAFLHKGKLLLCEEKDVLLTEYGILHCDSANVRDIASSAIIGKRETPFGVEAVVKCSEIPHGMNYSPVSIEELFVSMVKGEK